MEAFVGRSFRDEVTDEEFLSNLYAAPLIFVPGAGQSYCNTDYHLLALIIEQVSGMGYGDYVRENIFEKCGLEHTTAVIAGNETSAPKVFGDLLEAGIADENGYTMAPQGGRGGPEESTPALRTCGPSTGRSFQAFWSAKPRWRK